MTNLAKMLPFLVALAAAPAFAAEADPHAGHHPGTPPAPATQPAATQQAATPAPGTETPKTGGMDCPMMPGAPGMPGMAGSTMDSQKPPAPGAAPAAPGASDKPMAGMMSGQQGAAGMGSQMMGGKDMPCMPKPVAPAATPEAKAADPAAPHAH